MRARASSSFSTSPPTPLVAYDDLDDLYVLYLGPDAAGTLLEVLTAVDEQGEEIAFHAMPTGRKYRTLLP